MRKTIWFATVKDNVLHLENKALFQEYVSRLPEGTEVEIVLAPPSKDVTKQQWKYLYSCVYAPFAEAFGWTIDEADSYFKKVFCQAYQIQLPDGIELSKTCFDRAWLSKYIDYCIYVAAHHGVIVQPPNPKWRLEGSNA